MQTYGNRYIPENHAPLSGGMGSVVICRDPHLGRKVAIKFMLAGTEKRRLMDEVKALQAVRSKHVVQLYDIVIHQPGNNVGIVQEYLSGDDLVGFSSEGHSIAVWLRTAYQVACGIEDIHDQGLIHRDIKPHNARRDAEGIVKIIDFGLARDTSDAAAQTRGFVGTRGFAAPELYNAGLVKFTPAVDVYAFGATLYSLLHPRLPNDFLTNPPDAESWAGSGGFAAVHPGIQSRLANELDACLSTDPAQRPSMRRIRELIEDYLVFDQHRAAVTYNGATHWIHKKQRSLVIQAAGKGSVTVTYDGLGFYVGSVSGAVYLNNIAAVTHQRIPTSCVVTIGSPGDGRHRLFVTVDISQPEVVL